MRTALAITIAIGCVAACGSDSGGSGGDGDGGVNGGNGPRIVGPTDRIVVPAVMQIVTEAGPSDHEATEFEVIAVDGGALGAVVWRATITSGDLTLASLANGSFETGVSGLAEWSRYVIHARHRSAAGGLSDWGPNFPIRTDDGSESVFNENLIGEARVDIPSASYGPIDDEALSDCGPHVRSYYLGGLSIGGEDFPGSGVRAKGGCGSSRSLDEKSALKVNLSWDDPAVVGCGETRRYKGLKKITLNNQVEDPSYVHERIGYDFFRKVGVPVPRVAPINVYVNDELWGLYLNVESIDRRFLARRFDSNDGMLYEGAYGCDIGSTSCFEPKFSTDECDDPPTGDPTDFTPLMGLNDRLDALPDGGFYPAIREIINFDAYLSMWAAASIMGYWDGYPADANNYRVYHDPSDDRWTIIPTGIDQLFEDEVDPFSNEGSLSIRCLQEEACEEAFRARLAEVLDIYESSNYTAMARAIETQIQSAVSADPRREINLSEWSSAVNSTIQYIENRPGELRDLL